ALPQLEAGHAVGCNEEERAVHCSEHRRVGVRFVVVQKADILDTSSALSRAIGPPQPGAALLSADEERNAVDRNEVGIGTASRQLNGTGRRSIAAPQTFRDEQQLVLSGGQRWPDLFPVTT